MLNGRYGRVQESYVRQTGAGSGGGKIFFHVFQYKELSNFRKIAIKLQATYFDFCPCSFIAVNPRAVPKIYKSRMYASQDYSNKAQGGLSFKSGDTVYVLLRNGGGWCTGK